MPKFGVTHPVADHEGLFENEAHVIRLDWNLPRALLVYERYEFGRRGVPTQRHSQQKLGGMTLLDQSLHQHNVLTLYVECGSVMDLDMGSVSRR